MQNFTEMNFYDGTLNLNISLQQAHTNMAAMLAEVKKKLFKYFIILDKKRFFFHLFENLSPFLENQVEAKADKTRSLRHSDFTPGSLPNIRHGVGNQTPELDFSMISNSRWWCCNDFEFQVVPLLLVAT